jgi:hypothetical protein
MAPGFALASAIRSFTVLGGKAGVVFGRFQQFSHGNLFGAHRSLIKKMHLIYGLPQVYGWFAARRSWPEEKITERDF